MNQHSWVYGCYQYYLDNYIEPGNPEDGVWESAHWPVPKCKGGTKTILLLKEHHAVHGVLQSEEWNYPCIFGWEKRFLTGDLLVLHTKWRSALSSLAQRTRWSRFTPEERSQQGKERASKYTSEEWSQKARERQSRQTPEERSANVRKGHETRRRNGITAGGHTPESAKRAWETRRKNGSRKGGLTPESAKRALETRRRNAALRSLGREQFDALWSDDFGR